MSKFLKKISIVVIFLLCLPFLFKINADILYPIIGVTWVVLFIYMMKLISNHFDEKDKVYLKKEITKIKKKKELLKTIHVSNVNSVAFSPNNSEFAICDEQGIIIFDILDFKTIMKLAEQNNKREVGCLPSSKNNKYIIYSNDGGIIFSISTDLEYKGIVRWDTKNDKGSLATGTAENVTGLTDLFDNSKIAPISIFTMSHDKSLAAIIKPSIGRQSENINSELTIYNSQSYFIYEIKSFGISEYISSIAFCQDPTYILLGFLNGEIKLMNISNGNIIRKIKGHDGTILSINCSQDGKEFITCSADKKIKKWNTENWNENKTFDGHTDSVLCAIFNSNSKFIISGSKDETIKIWDAITGDELHTFKGHKGSIETISCSFNSEYLLSGSSDNTVKIWSLFRLISSEK